MSVFFLFAGLAILSVLTGKLLFGRIYVPSVVVYLLTGVLANALDRRFHFFTTQMHDGMDVRIRLGVGGGTRCLSLDGPHR